ncbi:Transposon Tf2-6 polyprotein, partial [Dictyocoela muelleri]
KINYLNKNIYINFIYNNGSTSANHANLNSKAEKEKILTKIESISDNQTYTPTRYIQIECIVPNTDLKLKRDLPLFDKISIDIFQAILTFRNTITMTPWDTTTIFNVFKSLCSDEISIIIENSSDLEKAFKEILIAKYPTQTNFRYKRFLKNLKLNNFYSVINYKYAIDETLKRMKIHKGYSKLELKRLSEESFIDGIPDNILTKFISEGQKTYSQIFERISDTETFIISRNCSNEIYKIKDSQKNTMWCKYHKSITHDDKDCVVQNDFRKNKNGKINNIKDYTILPYLFSRTDSNNSFKVLFDTGSTSSFINYKFLLKNRWNLENINTSVITSATGHKKQTKGIFKCILENSITKSTYNLYLKVIDDLEEKIIIGNDFLIENSVNINLGKMNLEFDGTLFKFNYSKTSDYCLIRPDYSTKKINENSNEELSKIFKDYNSKIDTSKPISHSEFSIPMKNNDTPALNPYPCPQFQEKLMKDEIKDLLDLKIIKRSNSLFAAPCFIKKKDDGTGRLLIDYRNLNKLSIHMQYHFPDIYHAFHNFTGSKIFSRIDLRKGFYQVHINPSDTHKTAFVTNMGKFEFTRIPFGLLNAPKFFHSLICEILFDISNVSVFVDDIIIYTKNIEENLKKITTVLNKLADRNVIVNFKKSEFLKTSLSYLGFTISDGKYTTEQSRLDNFLEWKTPKTKRELQKLLGKVNWYRKFIPNLSGKLHNLYSKLSNKSNKISITDEEIYEQIKQNIFLYIPDLNKEFTIHTDASEFAIGAVLTQESGIIDHYSKKLNSAQLNYSIVEKEMYAIFSAVNKWRPLISGSKIKIFTDNKNILGKSNDFSKKVNRWKASILDLNIMFEYISGNKNTIADNLSRSTDIKTNYINNTPNNSANYTNNPPTLENYLNTFHIVHGHPGYLPSYLTLRKIFNFPKGTNNLLKNLIKNCHFCQVSKINNRIYSEPKGSVITERPLKDISSDVYGPFDASNFIHNFKNDKLFIITFTDRCSRYSKCYFTTNVTSKEMQKAFKKSWLNNFNPPDTFLSDNAKYYTSNNTYEYFKSLNIRQVFASPYNPTCNSLSERINSTISNILRIYKGWNIKIIHEIIENRLNKIVNVSLKTSPYKIIFENESFTKNNSNKRKNFINFDFKMGNEILIKNEQRGKIEDPFYGPFKITRISAENNVFIF